MKICSNCGQAFVGNFCPNCGTRAPAEGEAVIQPAPPPTAAYAAPVTPPPTYSAPPVTPVTPQPYSAPPVAPAVPQPTAYSAPVAPVAPTAEAVQPDNQNTAEPVKPVYPRSAYPESRFTGGAFANYFIQAISRFVSLITLFIAFPAMRCWQLRWKYSHTYYNGKQLEFTGKAVRLMGRYMLWWLLSIVTLGIYYIVSMKVSMTKWETSNVHIANGQPGAKSTFDGHWYQLLGINLLTGFVTLITLFLGSFWAHCYKLKWYAKHKTIDGARIAFDGTGLQYFGKKIGWWLLTVITLFIYSFWRKVKTEKWNVKHTYFADPSEVGIAPMGGATPSGQVQYVKNEKGEFVPVAAPATQVQYVKNEKGEFVPVAAPATQVVQNTKSNSLAIAGFVLTLMPMPLTIIIGFILSIVGLVKSKAYNGNNKGLAIAGVVIGSLYIIAALIVILAIFVPRLVWIRYYG